MTHQPCLDEILSILGRIGSSISILIAGFLLMSEAARCAGGNEVSAESIIRAAAFTITGISGYLYIISSDLTRAAFQGRVSSNPAECPLATPPTKSVAGRSASDN